MTLMEPASGMDASQRRGDVERSKGFGMTRLMILMLPLFAATISPAAPSGACVDGETVLKNESMEISFASAAEGYGVSSIVNLLGGGRKRFVNRDLFSGVPAVGDLWSLELSRKGKDGKPVHKTISNRTPADGRSVERIADGLRFVFKGVEISPGKRDLDVIADVSLPAGAVESEWRIRVENRSREWGVYYTIYPVLRGVTKCGEGDFCEPSNSMGWRLHRNYDGDGVPAKSAYSAGVLPTALAYMIGDSGLLYAPHNSKAEVTKVTYSGRQNVSCCTPVVNAGRPASAADPGFPVSIGVFKGNWVAAAKLYRTWATNQVWCAKGRKFERKDYPEGFAEIPFWYRVSGRSQSVSNCIGQLRANWPEMKVGIHWYCWHNSDFDVAYPEYFPAKHGVKETMAYGRSRGCLMMPYINGRIWDKELISFRHLAHRSVCRRESGMMYEERYHGRVNGVMCPATPLWSDVVVDIASRLVSELGSGAVYFDQVGESRAEPCFSESHPHPAGGGTWWRESYAGMFSEIRRRHGGVPLATEGCGETWIDVIDGFLRALVPKPDVVPFYSAVYSDYAVYFGSPMRGTTDIDSFRAVQSLHFVWGVQNGWMGPWLFRKDKNSYADWMHCLGKARLDAKKYLAYGEYLDELKLLEPVQERDYEWPNTENPARQGVYRAKMAGVVGAWWRSPEDGSVALVAVNHTRDAQRVAFLTLDGERRIRTFAPYGIAIEPLIRERGKSGKDCVSKQN